MKFGKPSGDEGEATSIGGAPERPTDDLGGGAATTGDELRAPAARRRRCRACRRDRDVEAAQPSGAAVGIVDDARERSAVLLGKRVLVPACDPCGQCEVCRRGGAAVCPLATRRGAVGKRMRVASRAGSSRSARPRAARARRGGGRR